MKLTRKGSTGHSHRRRRRSVRASVTTLHKYDSNDSDDGLRLDKQSTVTQSEILLTKTYPPLWLNPMYQIQHRARVIPEFLSGSHYGYLHEVYQASADIYESLAVRRRPGESLVQYPQLKRGNGRLPSFSSGKVKQQSFELAYEALKYQDLLEEVLNDSAYFFSFPTGEDTTALAVVMLFDLQHRKWVPRSAIIGEQLRKEVSEVESNLLQHKVRLAAALARCRVKNQSLSIDYVLPESVREQEKCASTLPQFAWINTSKSSRYMVISTLKENGYTEIEDYSSPLPPVGKVFKQDLHSDDGLLFPKHQKDALNMLELVDDGILVLQDKTSSLAAKAVESLLTDDDEYDIVHSDVSSGVTTAHIAIILHNKTKDRMGKRSLLFSNPFESRSSSQMDDASSEAGDKCPEEMENSNRPCVLAFGVNNDTHMKLLQEQMKRLGVKNVKLFKEKFSSLDTATDSRFSRVKIILASPQCTRSAIANPVDFMLNEGDTDSLAVFKDLSNRQKQNRSAEAGRNHTEMLKSVMKCPSLQACVYITRSLHSSENEVAVSNALKYHKNNTNDKRRNFKVCPPTLPLSSTELTSEEENGSSLLLQKNYLRLKQSNDMNGCFIAVITREFNMFDSSVLRRGALQGLITPTTTTPPPILTKTPIQNESSRRVLPSTAKKPFFGGGRAAKSNHSVLPTLATVSNCTVTEMTEKQSIEFEKPRLKSESSAKKSSKSGGRNAKKSRSGSVKLKMKQKSTDILDPSLNVEEMLNNLQKKSSKGNAEKDSAATHALSLTFANQKPLRGLTEAHAMFPTRPGKHENAELHSMVTPRQTLPSVDPGRC